MTENKFVSRWLSPAKPGDSFNRFLDFARNDSGFMCSISSYDKQGEPGDEIEHHPQHLVQCNKRVEHRVDRFPGYVEEPVVYRVCPIAGKDTNQGRANQYYPVNNRAPQKNCPDSNDIHSVSPFSFVFLI